MLDAAETRVLPEELWQARAQSHADRIDASTAGHRERAPVAAAHPVEDFLFTYYSVRPSRLRRWHPGADVALEGPSALDRLGWRGYRRMVLEDPDGRTVEAVGVDVDAYVSSREMFLSFLSNLLSATAERPPSLGCFGLHEWAMAYRLSPEEQRHAAWPLRLGSAGTDTVVESHRIRCTHADAFRFFTPAAVHLNVLQPQRSTQVSMEQPGCLHATMDLYKWAYKLGPVVPGELLADCFELARDVRILDMRASPYDLSALGYEPVRIEDADGKATYVETQRRFAERAQPLRLQLLEICDRLLDRSAMGVKPAANPSGQGPPAPARRARTACE